MNSNDCDKLLKTNIMGKFKRIQHSPDTVVLTNCASQIDANLEYGKSAGPDRICAEYLKFSNDKITFLIALCFTKCLSHGYLPTALIEPTIVPIAKNKSGNQSRSNNYLDLML